ncbi:hypothetical protein [Paratissierella segnis]|jgi:hypothetical protein|nr:hypothetical protein [Paratissierella segnis]
MDKNNLDQLKIADISENELKQVKDLEGQLDDKYYIVAFEKEE